MNSTTIQFEDRPGDQGRQLAENGAITKSERASLLQLARLRARSWDSDKTWTEMAKLMEKAKREAQAQVIARNRELGIPDWAAPSLNWYWREQGQQATKERKTELRRLAATQMDAMIKAAKSKIDEASLAIQTELHASGLTSDAARAFLERMPTPEALMPSIEISALETKLLR